MSKPADFVLFGSIVSKGRDARDIDLIVPEFTGDESNYTAVSLDRYELLAHETGKPIDLFFTTHMPGFNVAAYYDGKEWTFRLAFCGKWFFEGAQAIGRDELLCAVRRTPAQQAAERRAS
jgi:hypothetical protein